MNRIIVALDLDSIEKTRDCVIALKDHVAYFKVGKGLFTRFGHESADIVLANGGRLFLDLKFHDIPAQVDLAVRAAAAIGASMATLHTAGGARMLEAAAKARDATGGAIKLLGVTVLTSMDSGDLEQTGCLAQVEKLVLKRALLARGCGLDGVIASPLEISLIREECPKPFLIVTPGIRPSSCAGNDQKRVATPENAVREGADYIVVGRSILKAADPVKAIEAINSEIMSLYT